MFGQTKELVKFFVRIFMDKNHTVPNKLKSSPGFSLIEMLVAMAILILCLSAVIMVSFGNQSALTDSQTGAEGLHIAQNLLENEQALARKDFKMVNPINQSGTDSHCPSQFIYDGSRYCSKIDVVNQPDNMTKLVTATVSWSGDPSVAWSSPFSRHETTQLSALVTNFDNAIGGDTCSSVLSGDWTHPVVKNTVTDFSQLAGDGPGIYNITDMDAYQGKLYVTVNNNGEQITVGPKLPSTGVDDNTNGSTLPAWSNPANITSSTDGGASASVTLNGTRETHYLKASNFGFNIPSDATVQGIVVTVKRTVTGGTTGNVNDSQIKIVKSSGAIGAANRSTGSNWASTGTLSVGSTSDLWGETWTAGDINNANFGVVIAAVGSSGTNRKANVDYIQITVYYQKPTLYIFDTNKLINNLANPLITEVDNDPINSTGLAAVAVDGKYAYVASQSSFTNGQLQIIDISVTPPVVVKTFKLPAVLGSSTQGIGNSIFYKNGYVFLGLTKTTNNSGAGGMEFNIIDVNKVLGNLPNPVVGTYDALNTINAIYVKGNYAYLATTNNSEELTVLDISTPSSPQRVGWYNAAGNSSGKSLYLVGDTLYLGKTTSASPEFFLLNNADPKNLTANNPAPATEEIGSSINGLIQRDYLEFLITTNSQFEVWNLSNTSTPLQITSATQTLPGFSAGSTMDCEGNYFYVGSIDAANKGYLSVITAP